VARFGSRYADVTATLALFVALGGGAIAATQFVGDDGLITACVDRKTGDMRALPASKERCARGEAKVRWNRRGRRGATGPTGATGPQGETGRQGEQGPPGAPGEDVDASQHYTKTESDARFAASSVFGTPRTTEAGDDSGECTISEMRLFAGSRLPDNWRRADGSVLPISQNTPLFSLLGTTYGGNGQSTFALPDLRAATPNGGRGTGPVYAICVIGLFPPSPP
jgi:hypothetical protein